MEPNLLQVNVKEFCTYLPHVQSCHYSIHMLAINLGLGLLTHKSICSLYALLFISA